MHFARPLGSAASTHLQNATADLEMLIKTGVSGADWTVEYEFPACCFADIWQRISDLAGSGQMSFLHRLYYSLCGFAEQNERDHRLYPCHWHTYVEDIYMHYFEYGASSTADARNKLWRRYKVKPGIRS